MREYPRTLEAELTGNELSSLISILREKSFSGKHLEIGTASGGTLCRMMKAFDNNDRPPFVVVDPMTYFKDQMTTIRKNLRDNGLSPDGIDFRVMKSNKAFISANQNRESFDFIFIDGAHKVNYVTDDLKWTRLLIRGGIVCLHDYSSIKGVRLAVNRFLRRHPNYVKINCVDTLLILCKTTESAAPEVSITDTAWAAVMAPLLRFEVFLAKKFRRKNNEALSGNKLDTPV